MSEVHVRELDAADAEASVAVMLEAFVPDPNMRWCFLADEPGYLDRLRGYFEVGHDWHTRLGFPVLGAYDEEGLVGVAYVMGPNPEIPTGGEFALLPRMRQVCGDAAVDRFAQYNEAVETETPETPAHCIALLAVLETHQGGGIGSRLVERIIADAGRDPSSGGVVLDTGNPRNLVFYGRHGFERVGRVELDGLVEHVLFHPCSEGPPQ